MKVFLVILALAGTMLASVLPAAAGPPTVREFQDVFVDVNPCTGLEHTVTIDVTLYTHVPWSSHGVHTITTDSGFVGRGGEAEIFGGDVFVLNDMLVNRATGERIRAQLHVIGVGTTEPRVLRSSVVCVKEA